jgi:UDP-N-acetylmuramoyl-tripeptide--D-alanyl-D-alanine ligase
MATLAAKDFQEVGALIGAGESWKGIVSPKVVIDSRKAEKDALFVALKGEKQDGHDYVKMAFEKGASLALVSKNWFEKNFTLFSDKLFLVVPEPLSGLQKLATVWRKKFSMPVVAIGGNSGKTTTKEMTAAVLRSSFKTLATQGNLNNHIGVPLTLFGLTEQTEIAVIEMGMNHPNEMMQLCTIAEPTHGLITNIGKAHIEFFKSIDEVAKAEGELFEYLGVHGGSAFVNTGDALVMKQSEKVDGKFFYGLSTDADIYAEELGQNEMGCSIIKLGTAEQSETLTLKISGRHNIHNALAAAAVGLNFGVPLGKIKHVLESFEISPSLKRMSVSVEKKVVLINDTYNANPESMRAGLTTLCDMKNAGKKIAVLGDMLELGAMSKTEHESLGAFIGEKKIDTLLCFGKEMKITCLAAEVKTKFHFESKPDLVKTLIGIASAGDAILFKGSRGMKMEECLEEFRSVMMKAKD